MDLTPAFRDLFAAFAAHDVRYLVCGGYAAAAYGNPRYVKDLDAWIDLAPPNPVRVVAALEAIGFAGLGITAADFGADAALELGYEPVLIDVLTSMRDLAFGPAHDARVVVTVDGVDIPLLDRERVLHVKRAIGRRQDATDLAALERDGAPRRPIAELIREAERARRAAAAEHGDIDAPIARAVRRKTLREPTWTGG
jgi:hypothetical protein